MASHIVSQAWGEVQRTFIHQLFLLLALFVVLLSGQAHADEQIKPTGYYWKGTIELTHWGSPGGFHPDNVKDGYDAQMELCNMMASIDAPQYPPVNIRLVDLIDPNISSYSAYFVADSNLKAFDASKGSGYCIYQAVLDATTGSLSTRLAHFMQRELKCPSDSSKNASGSCTCHSGYYANPNKTSCQALAKYDPRKTNLGRPITCVANPCDGGTGHKFQSETDYVGSGAFPLELTRVYNSGGPTQSVVEATHWGANWNFGYDRNIVRSNDGRYASLRRADGRRLSFWLLDDGTWVGDADEVGQLSYELSGPATATAPAPVLRWKYITSDSETEVYDGLGRLSAIRRPGGLEQTLTYNVLGTLYTIKDPQGSVLTFDYDSQNRIKQITDPAGKLYLYQYDANNNLSQVTYPDGAIRQYRYGETALVSATPNAGISYLHSLTGIVEGAGQGKRFASWSYDAAGRAASSEHGAIGSGIEKVSMAYGDFDIEGKRTTQITDTRGVSRTYSFSTIRGMVRNTAIGTQPCIGCVRNSDYDNYANVIRQVDFNGYVSCYGYDINRNVETIRFEGLGVNAVCPADLSTYTPPNYWLEARKISTEWHSSLRLPSRIAEPLRIVTYSYESDGRIKSVTTQATKDTTGYAGFSATVDGLARTTTYSYYTSGIATGRLYQVNGPRTDVADVTTHTYDSVGRLSQVTNAAGHITTLSDYDAHGLPHTMTDANQQITRMVYDARNRLASSTRGGETTTYNYNDDARNLTNVTFPHGASYTYSYDDAHRLTRITDKDGNYIQYTLDTSGNRTKEEVKYLNGTVVKVHSRIFNTLNQLWKDIGAINSATTIYTYDNNSNLKTITDPLARLTTHNYDALNRLTSTIEPPITAGVTAGKTQYGYNAQNQLVKVTDPRNLITQYTRNGFGETTEQISPDTGKTSYAEYDLAGNLNKRIDEKKQATSYKYDVLNRMTLAEHRNSAGLVTLIIAYSYDAGTYGKGHLTGISETAYTGGTTTQLGTPAVVGTSNYSYNQLGRLVTETRNQNGVNYITSYGYDTVGRLNSITYPSGRVVSYTFDTQGRINKISTTYGSETIVLASSINYFPFGGIKSFNYGDGLTQPVQTYSRNINTNGLISEYSLGKQNNSGVIKGNQYTVQYDNANQLQKLINTNLATNGIIATDTFTYNGLGHLTGTTGQTLVYDSVGNRTSQTIGTASSSYTYPTTSNRLSAITKTGATTTLNYDSNGSITKDISRSAYEYDTRGRLISTTSAAGLISYTIDAQGKRVRKQGAGNDTIYHYNQQGQLIAESKTGSTNVLKEYVYLDDLPIAVLQ